MEQEMEKRVLAAVRRAYPWMPEPQVREIAEQLIYGSTKR